MLVRHGGLTSLDGDLSVVAQGHDQVVGQGFVDLDGKRWFDVFGDGGLVSGDSDLDQVTLVASARSTRARLVSYCSGYNLIAQRQLLEVIPTRNRLQLVRQSRLATHVHIIANGNGGAARDAVGWNSDFGPVSQRERQCPMLSDWQALSVAQGYGVGNLPAFCNSRLVGR
ncbi:hypothetical protein EDP1_4192 [Pseudomonas putida S610]|nr:hypothetical protein EDP1_4192 [Pseudomonas putida S610]